MVHEALTSRACEEAFSYERVETMGDAVCPQKHVHNAPAATSLLVHGQGSRVYDYKVPWTVVMWQI